MIIVTHTAECSGVPVEGRLTGVCDCKTAKLTDNARLKLKVFLGELAGDSLAAGEECEYFALRLEMLEEMVESAAKSVRRTAKRSDKRLKSEVCHASDGDVRSTLDKM